MRAEMTVGFEIESLQNLRIFNGYAEQKRERKSSLELPSSPEEFESDTGLADQTTSDGTKKTRSKCGRPANPIPRHKRQSHIKAEYKRRDKIQKGFDTLLSTVPSLIEVSSAKETTEYCRQLKTECASSKDEIEALQRELESLGTDIQNLQDQLPQHGSNQNKEVEMVSMDTLYDQYVTEQTKKNWKFWIFGFFMRPLYDSFKRTMANKNTLKEFSGTVQDWVQTTLSLKTLRKGILESLRYMSKHTSIMTTPEQLEEEAHANVHRHFLCKARRDSAGKLDLGPRPKTESPSGHRTPRTPTPIPGPSRVAGSVPGTPCSQTPLHTPCPTPPRTPVVSRRNSKRESVRSMESRSRSNSPAQEENKAKRRSGYRSRSGRRTPSDAQDDNRPLEFLSSRPSHAIQTPFAQYMVTSQNASAPNTSVVAMVTGSSFIPTVAMTTTVNLVKVASITTTGPSESSYVPMTTESAFSPTVGMTTTSNMMQGSSMATRVFNATYNSMKSEQPLDNNINDPLVASFVESLISAMQPHSQLPKLNTMLTTDSANMSQLRLSLPIRSPVQAPSSSQMFIPETQRNTTTLQDSFLNQTSMSTATPHRGENHKQAFVPLNRPVVIKEGILTPVFTSASNNTNMSQNLSSSSLMAMDTTSINSLLSVQNCVTSHSPMVQCSEADPLLCGASNMDLTMAGGASVNGATKPESAFMEFLNNEEDSLMNMLKVDVLDVNSVLSFFTDS
ncbi:MLXIP-like protein [Mya arenaria]|uniref:MLXIP-like protein n=1 Tax=Mya arenaria TaxID=6604 RepID=A0ABY7EJE7_MYAAR|nr:MLXIP-like protein [Mya arenaria]